MSASNPATEARCELFRADAELAYGEQAALLGVLSVLHPALSLELGTFRGGSLNHIAAYSREVHSFDLVSHTTDVIPNVSYHLGDTATTLPRLLRELTEAERNVDFVFVDADHSRAGVARDMGNLLRASALARTVILLHDCANEAVRAGARDALVAAADIAYADLSFVIPAASSSLLAEAWGGLGIVVIDREGDLWQLQRRILDNVYWRTSHPRSRAWNAFAPVRACKRALAYRARPMYRRIKGSRGVPMP